MAGETRASHAKVYGVDVVLDEEENIDNPYCEHGPTVLFEKFIKNKPSQKYYACSACRERKDCNFFQLKDEKITKGKEILQKEIKKKLFGKKKKSIKQLSTDDKWCFDCGVVVATVNNPHQLHSVRFLNANELKTPTLLINPKSDKKTNAQYFFSEETCKLFITMITKLQFKKIICVGTPRLFEMITSNDKLDASAILLDIDDRFKHFYDGSQYQQYNMFNDFFFDATNGKKSFDKFLSDAHSNEILIIVDPPFGGMATLLANTLSKLWKECGDDNLVATMLVFPYFLESHVINTSMSTLQMLDYKVSYTNHPHFNNLNKRGSPVRIFTNIPADKISLPQEHYRFCKLCQRYVYKENRHCNVCKLCTSKDGRTYIHCSQCEKCVKPGRLHCETCKNCEAVGHKCNRSQVVGCHICGSEDHKRKDCTNKPVAEEEEQSVGEKRKMRSIKQAASKQKGAAKNKKRKTVV